MGNLCSCCFKNEDQSELNNSQDDQSQSINSHQPSISSPQINERTPLLSNPNDRTTSITTPMNFDFPSNGEISPVIPPPQQQVPNRVGTETKTETETADSKMASIVESMITKLIDVSGTGSNIAQANSNAQVTNTDNDSLKELLFKSLTSPRLLNIPDVDINSVPSLLAGQPVSSDICLYVAHAAVDFSNFLSNDMKIIHKEQLVVVFE